MEAGSKKGKDCTCDWDFKLVDKLHETRSICIAAKEVEEKDQPWIFKRGIFPQKLHDWVMLRSLAWKREFMARFVERLWPNTTCRKLLGKKGTFIHFQTLHFHDNLILVHVLAENSCISFLNVHYRKMHIHCDFEKLILRPERSPFMFPKTTRSALSPNFDAI